MKTRAGRNRLFVIDKKTIKIAVIAFAIIIVIIVIAVIINSGKKVAVKHASVENLLSVGIINVGLRGDLGPLCMYDSSTKTFKGLEKDLADEMLKRVFGGNIIVNYIEADSETKDSLLISGGLDMSFGASVKGSTKGIDYSNTYFTEGSAFLVRKGELTSQSGLNAMTIAVVQGSLETASSSQDKKLTNMEEYLKTQNIHANIKTYASYPEAVEALRVKLVTAVCASESFLKLFGKAGMVILPERFLPYNYCIETRTSLDGFVDTVNDGITAMKNDGTIDSLLQKWNLTDYSKKQ